MYFLSLCPTLYIRDPIYPDFSVQSGTEMSALFSFHFCDETVQIFLPHTVELHMCVHLTSVNRPNSLICLVFLGHTTDIG